LGSSSKFKEESSKRRRFSSKFKEESSKRRRMVQNSKEKVQRDFLNHCVVSWDSNSG